MAAADLRSRYVMAGHIRTHYCEAGYNGPPVVLCHGGGAGSSGEAGFGRVMPFLATKLQAYAPDGVGGFGDTDPTEPAHQGAQSIVDQLEAFVDALCLDQFGLAGNSRGAWVAARYAILHPERVRKLFLISSRTIAEAMGMKLEENEAMSIHNSYDGTREGMRRVLEPLLYDKSQLTEDVIDLRLAAANRPGAAEARKSFAQGMQRLMRDPVLKFKYDMRAALPNLPIPAMFIWGEDDIFAPPEIGHQLEKLLPNIPFRWISKAGHQVQNDQPQVVGQIMLDFFGS